MPAYYSVRSGPWALVTPVKATRLGLEGGLNNKNVILTLALAKDPPGFVVLDGVRGLGFILQVGSIDIGQLQLIVDCKAATLKIILVIIISFWI